ncbi:hypothetical protein [Arcanobacterium hippocoleae]|uniref:Uncharacterized protein n=1 Tax=Arcanobacterium hippocoleae TaxID=149017 RepID=A0ABU1T0T1_9ACTO|nr:hypothetical protein [Arcanobacterium hippocoleae]MDR6938979.1 hypothetical protein [Arcanobacterium hippocoleae]
MSESEVDPQGIELTKQADGIVDDQQAQPGLSAADLERLRRAQKRNMIIAIIFGLLLATLGYFAGANMRAQHHDRSMSEMRDEVCVVQTINSQRI